MGLYRHLKIPAHTRVSPHPPRAGFAALMFASGPSGSSASHADAESLALVRRLQEEDDAAFAAQLMAREPGDAALAAQLTAQDRRPAAPSNSSAPAVGPLAVVSS